MNSFPMNVFLLLTPLNKLIHIEHVPLDLYLEWRPGSGVEMSLSPRGPPESV